jgi:phosphate-selective porin OprO/OprP
VATGNLNVSSYHVVGSELLWVDGPISLQSEAMVTMCDFQGQSCALPGVYAQAGWFLTGEHRPYDRKQGAIDRVIPKENFGYNAAGGSGAWEVATRFSWLDLSDHDIKGGQLTDWTAGVNWYWNPYTKLVFNYVHSMANVPGSSQSQTDMFGLRAQVDF